MAIESGKGVKIPVDVNVRNAAECMKTIQSELAKLKKEAENLSAVYKETNAEIERIQKSLGLTADEMKTISKLGEDEILRRSEQEQHLAKLLQLIEQYKSQQEQIVQKTAELNARYEELSAIMSGTSENGIAAEFEETASSAESASQSVEKLSSDLSNVPSLNIDVEGFAEANEQASKIATHIESTQEEMASLKARIASVNAEYKKELAFLREMEKYASSQNFEFGGVYKKEVENQRQKVNELKAVLDELSAKYEEVNRSANKLRGDYQNTINVKVSSEGAEKTSNALDNVGESAQKAGEQSTSAANKGATAWERFSKRIDRFKDRLGRMIQRFIIMKTLNAILSGIKNTLDLASKSSDTLAGKFNELKQKALIAFYPAIEKASHALEKLVNWAIKAVEYIGAFIHVMTGSDVSSSVAGAQKLYEKLDSTIDAQIAANKQKIKEIDRQIKEENRLYKQQKKAIDDQKDTLNDQIEAYKKNIKALQKEQQKKRKIYEQEKEAIQDSIDAINKRIKALQKQEKAENKLYEAQKKTIEAQIKILKEQKQQRTDEIEAAKDAADAQIDATNAEIKAIDKQIKALEKELKARQDIADEEKKSLASFDTLNILDTGEEQKDAETQAIEDQIEALQEKREELEEQRDLQQEMRDQILDASDDPIIKQIEARIEAYETEKDRIDEAKEAMQERYDSEIEKNQELVEQLQDESKEIDKIKDKTDEEYEVKIQLQQDKIDVLEDKIDLLEKQLDKIDDEHTIKIDGLEKAKSDIEDLNNNLETTKSNLTEPINDNHTIFHQAKRGIEDAQKKVDDFGKTLGNLGDTMGNVEQTNGEMFHNIVKNIKKFVTETLPKWWAKLDQWWYDNVDTPINNAFADIYNDFISPLIVEPFLRLIADIKLLAYKVKAWWFSTALPFIQSLFTKEFWTEKWSAVKDGAKSAFNGVLDVVERAVNWIIEKINTISWDVPDWVPGIGGQTFGFNFEPINIPRLAKGAVIPGGAPFMAILGDQPAGKKNYEVPEDDLRKLIREEMQQPMQIEVVNRFEGNLNQFARVIEPYVEVVQKRKSAFA